MPLLDGINDMPGASTNPALMNPALHDEAFQAAFRSKIITLIAPASGAPSDIIQRLQQLPGLTVNVPHDLVNQTTRFHANTDEIRFQQLKTALYDDTSEIIWTLRGGYGSARLLDRLKRLSPPKQEKIFIGFSDNTALHLFLSQSWHWRTIHASGMTQLLSPTHDPHNYTRIAELVAKQVKQQRLTRLVPLNDSARNSTSVTGVMNGGNLTLVENSIGTHWQIQTAGALLFLEEVGEKGYRLDRSLYHLRQAGLLDKVRGIVFGECSGPDEAGIAEALARFAQETSIPVYQTHQFGHETTNYPIIYQALAEITSADGSDDFILTMDVS